jgi:hypothetical protein
MDSRKVIEREDRWGRTAGLLGIIGILLFVGAGVLGLADEFNNADDLAGQLEAFSGESGQILVQLLVQATGILLFIPPLLFLFQAAAARSERVRAGLVGLCFAGPLFFAGALIATWFALDAAAEAFRDDSEFLRTTWATFRDVAGGIGEGIDVAERPTGLDDIAEDTIAAQGAASVASGLRFAGLLGLVFIALYTALHAMRTGLLTRFWGTLLMALGIGMLFLGLPAILAYFLSISLLVAGWWAGGRPPAWETGEATPWPSPGEQKRGGEDIDEHDGEELARPEDFEGTGTEIESEIESERPGRRDNRRKRKRKKRG